VGERELIEDATEELERSGLLDGRGAVSYGGVEERLRLDEELLLDADQYDDGSSTDSGGQKKNALLNAETKQFMSDHTMWLLALAFLLVTGPGEAFINNLGTIIGTLSPPQEGSSPLSSPLPRTTAATHVSIVGLASTIARLATGSLTDFLAPSPDTSHLQYPTPYSRPLTSHTTRLAISRIMFLVLFALVLSAGLATLALGTAQNHADRFWIVSALVGAGYGAVFSLTPIIIAVIWGVENFATNWGVVAMVPALGSTIWGLTYSAVYQNEAASQGRAGGFCYGEGCYRITAWTMAGTVWLAVGVLMIAWRGRGGWLDRGVVV